jgi:Arc/MetJ-type ribon-helix-helix transcriptional regulator
MKSKVTVSIELEQSMNQFLEEMVNKHQLPDVGKAVRCLVNYARDRPNQQEEIFEEIRCLDC